MTTGPLAVRSDSLTGLPSVPLSAKSGAFCPTSRALAAPTGTRPANRIHSATTTVRDVLIDRVLLSVDRQIGPSALYTLRLDIDGARTMPLIHYLSRLVN